MSPNAVKMIDLNEPSGRAGRRVMNAPRYIASTSSKPIGLPKILLVEKNAEIVQLIFKCLADGHELKTVNNSLEAYEILSSYKPDLIISDVSSPDLSANLFLKKLRLQPELAHIPFIALVTNSNDQNIVQALRDDACDYVAKPFNNQEFTAKVASILKVKAAEAKYRNLLEHAQDAMIIVNAKGNIEFANEQASHWFGYAPQELLQRPVSILVPERKKEVYKRAQLAFLANPQKRHVGGNGLKIPGQRKDGSELLLDISLGPVFTSEGVKVIVVIRDVTERNKREEQLRFLANLGCQLSESLDFESTLKKFLLLVVPNNAAACAIWLTSKRGVKLHTFKQGRSSQDAPANTFRDLLEAPFPELQTAIDSKKSCYCGFKSKSQEGALNAAMRQEEWWSCVLSPLYVRGKNLGVIGFFFNSEKNSFAEHDSLFFDALASRIATTLENAKLYEEAKKSIKLREEVLEIMSHDLKSPLVAIDMWVQFLQIGKQPNTESAIEVTKKIQRSAAQMRSLINDLLDFAKVQGAELTVEKQNEEVMALIESTIEIFCPLLEQKSQNLHLDIPEDLPRVYCDLNRVSQVLSNLISNASKFSPKGSSITISARALDKKVEFSVIDNGTGILPEDLPKVFDRFWQAKSNRKQGTVLGLSIARGIIEAHDQQIWCDSEPGKGTRFSFTLAKCQI